MIREIEKDYVTDKFVRVDWDGRDQDGNNIANGTYLIQDYCAESLMVHLVKVFLEKWQ